MRKYWKVVAILALIVVGVSTYLVQTALASQDLPRFEIEHKNGDESVVEDVSFSGAYVQHNIQNVFRFDGEETEYSIESSFIEEMIGSKGPVEEELIEKYRDFMRGKPYLYNNFYNGDDALVIVEEDWNYTGQSRAKLNVSYLNKETEKELETVINVENAHYANVIEVQYMDGRIHIYVNYAEQESRILREFIYDVEGEAIVSDKKS
ncbi:hypothetical protein [Piscibacillus salipiscarius]|uniref:hypothetical protein n=1 Tax=Piscibacillus salipiscarius TaxID=299480 RepID=UPI0006CF3465|nr:hypothetical protein [Piscibacillus salipiscarius]